MKLIEKTMDDDNSNIGIVLSSLVIRLNEVFQPVERLFLKDGYSTTTRIKFYFACMVPP